MNMFENSGLLLGLNFIILLSGVTYVLSFLNGNQQFVLWIGVSFCTYSIVTSAIVVIKLIKEIK